MKKESSGLDFVVRREARGFDALKGVRGFDALGSRCVRLGLVAAMGASLALSLSDAPRAQQQRYRETPVRVRSVTTNGNVVSIDADGSLNHAQTWQEPDGPFHVVLVNGEADPGVGRGVRVGRVGNSLELVVPVRRGANVTVQPRGNRLDLVVSGGGGALSVENFPVEQRSGREQREEQRAARQEQSESPEQAAANERAQTKAEQKRRAESSGYEFPQSLTQSPAANTQAGAQTQPQAAQPSAQTNAPAGDVQPPLPQPANAPQEPAKTDTAAQAAAPQASEGGGFDLLSFLFSLPSMLVLLCVALAGAFAVVMRRRHGDESEGEAEQKTQTTAVASETPAQAKTSAQPFQTPKGDRRKQSIAVPFDRRTSGAGAEDEATRRGNDLATEANTHLARKDRVVESASAPAFVHGSYRIDQEVALLVAGAPHSIEVLASRAADDRRAVETSLLKALRAHETDEDGQRRARQALEDYGFVARSCASLLLGSETFERVSAARSLADMKSSQALPFLTEALYDPDPVVRNECVQSLGALGLPSAIGALLDVARRHQDVPAAILGPALTACSVESLELGWESPAAARHYARHSEADERAANDVRSIVPAAERYEELPEFIEDESLTSALARIESADAESRVMAAQQLAQFQVRRAVAALASAACGDAESAVRSAAVNSLGLINHESVFAYVIIALADEAREVRAAAARALSRLSFDRADAYVSLAEMADSRTVREVARACVKAGLAAQAVARLTSEDRRQAFESFSLLSLCVSGGQAEPVVEAVEGHRDINARMACIQLLGESRDARVHEQLRRLAESGGVPDGVRRSIRETVERVAPPAVEETEPVAVTFE
ncbi:MAG TPA: HEAT repeat domain-containing protein [Pyrinomonadaceae bacterium]|nr:HEAT repeat domain-containing protein [Pyrinomonadaceae bacterium]